jgi:SAM-dependent methyltransferase
MKLLDKRLLIRTGGVDHADWNFKFPLGVVQKLRFRMALSLLPDFSCQMLEIGYGSGVFMPSLAERAGHLHGVDVHPRAEEVSEVLLKVRTSVTLKQASAEELPYDSHTFDCVVAVSALEFVDNLDLVCKEVKRVLKPSGIFVAVTPGHSALVDLGLRILTGKKAQDDFGNRRENIIPVLTEHFRVGKKSIAPPVLGFVVPLYVGLRLVKPF